MTEKNFPIKLDDCTLYAADEDCTESALTVEDKAYTLVLVKNGRCRIACCGKECELAKGQSMLILPFERFEVEDNACSGFTLAVLSFTVNAGNYGESFGGIRSALPEPDKRIFADEALNATSKNICLELMTADRAYSNQMLSLLCSQLLVYILRNVGTYLEDSEANDANLRICGQVMSYIDSRIYSMRNLREVAAAIGYNYSYISTLFRKTVGITLNAYFKTKRMNEARKLLQDNKTSVSEIARIMNYSSVYAFSKAFKAHFGASPGHYSGRFSNKDI